MSAIKLSILVLTVPRRVTTFFPKLVERLQSQALERPVEILGLYDNQKRTVGEKRNALMGLAQGDYIVFIDDDDWVDDTYVQAILEGLAAAPDVDVLCFEQLCTDNGASYRCLYSLAYEYERSSDGTWYGKPAHTMVWRAALAKACEFPTSNYAEDMAWVAQACRLANTEHRIDARLYHYRFRADVSETRTR